MRTVACHEELGIDGMRFRISRQSEWSRGWPWVAAGAGVLGIGLMLPGFRADVAIVWAVVTCAGACTMGERA